jgi:predicted short-subunit dehydrogenase-like oxidoreductase (DUF2520 family)
MKRLFNLLTRSEGFVFVRGNISHGRFAMKISVVGAGNVGTTLAVLLKRAGHTITGVASRTAAGAARAGELLGVPHGIYPSEFTREADVTFLTVPDRAIAGVCAQIAACDGFRPGSVVIHTSGAHSSDLLAPARNGGSRALSFHPLQSFAGPAAGIANLPGSFVTIEGDEGALQTARQLASDLSCQTLEIPTESKALYHAAACMVCNYFVTLVDLGLQMLEAAGIKREEGLPAIRPLVECTLQNILRSGPAQALTGPIARGDSGTVQSHLELMDRLAPSLIPLYKTLGQATVGIAAAKGSLAAAERETLLKILGGA